MMEMIPILENEFYHDGRGPELKLVVWKLNGVIPEGFEYYNPDDVYDEDSLKNIRLEGVQIYSMAPEENHGNIMATNTSKAGIHEVINSEWLKSFNQTHLGKCKHFQIAFYDEIYDIICEKIVPGKGKLKI